MKIKNLLLTLLFLTSLTLVTCKKIERLTLIRIDLPLEVINTEATISGVIVDVSKDCTEYGFCYSTTAEPDISSPTIVVGVPSEGIFSKKITGLTKNTTYYLKPYYKETDKIIYLDQINFTTPDLLVATAATNDATQVLSVSALLNGNVNAKGSTTTVTFEYGTTSSYGQTATATPETVTGTASTNVSASVTGLTLSTLYHFRIKVVNAGGTAYGLDKTFTTASTAAPTATTTDATAISNVAATINGTVNANSSSTTVTFEYGLTTSYGQTSNGTPNTVTGSTSTTISANLTGLTANKLYHFRIKAVNAGGITYGSDKTFTTSSTTSPIATTTAATLVATTTATLNGTVNANNLSTAISFEYGTTTSYGKTVTASPSNVGGATNNVITASLTNLTTNTTYHFRIKAVSTAGTSYGNDLTFKTSFVSSLTNISQTFESQTVSSDVVISGWLNYKQAGTRAWSTRQFGSPLNKYAQFSAFSSTAPETSNIAWLITPAVNLNLTTNEIFSFYYNSGYYTGEALTVYYSTDFDGTEAGVAIATWNEITSYFNLPVSSSTAYNTIASAGSVNFKSILGTAVYFAFKYTGSGVSGGVSTTIQLDNITFTGTKDGQQVNLLPKP